MNGTPRNPGEIPMVPPDRRGLFRRRRPAPGMPMPRGQGIGDEQSRQFDPEQRRYDIEEKSGYLPRISVPSSPVAPSTEEVAARLKEIGLTIPGLSLVVDAFCRCISDRLECLPVHVKNPTWLEPPVSALPIDLFNKKNICPSSPVGFQETILEFVVPERMVAVLLRFGNEIEDIQLMSLVKWTIQRGDAAWSRFYQDFSLSLGTIQRPEAFGAPIIAPPNTRVRVLASIGGVDCTNVFARLIGFMFPLKENTFDGDWPSFCMAS